MLRTCPGAGVPALLSWAAGRPHTMASMPPRFRGPHDPGRPVVVFLTRHAPCAQETAHFRARGARVVALSDLVERRELPVSALTFRSPVQVLELLERQLRPGEYLAAAVVVMPLTLLAGVVPLVREYFPRAALLKSLRRPPSAGARAGSWKGRHLEVLSVQSEGEAFDLWSLAPAPRAGRGDLAPVVVYLSRRSPQDAERQAFEACGLRLVALSDQVRAGRLPAGALDFASSAQCLQLTEACLGRRDRLVAVVADLPGHLMPLFLEQAHGVLGVPVLRMVLHARACAPEARDYRWSGQVTRVTAQALQTRVWTPPPARRG